MKLPVVSEEINPTRPGYEIVTERHMCAGLAAGPVWTVLERDGRSREMDLAPDPIGERGKRSERQSGIVERAHRVLRRRRNLGIGRRFSRAAFERPLPYVQLTEPNARTVATAVQNGLHQFRWSPLERMRCTSFQADVFLVDQIMVKIADDGEVPRRVADAMAAVLNMMNV